MKCFAYFGFFLCSSWVRFIVNSEGGRDSRLMLERTEQWRHLKHTEMNSRRPSCHGKVGHISERCASSRYVFICIYYSEIYVCATITNAWRVVSSILHLRTKVLVFKCKHMNVFHYFHLINFEKCLSCLPANSLQRSYLNRNCSV